MTSNNYRRGINMDKSKVLELAQQCQLIGMRPHLDGIYEQSLQQFAALIEAQVRERSNRDNVFELMLQAGCTRYCNPEHPELEGFIVNDSVLDRIVALIEAEVRGDAEPVAYETDTELWSAYDPGINNWIRKNGRPLYTPAVVRQLVEALSKSAKYLGGDNPRNNETDKTALAEIYVALAAAKEAGL